LTTSFSGAIRWDLFPEVRMRHLLMVLVALAWPCSALATEPALDGDGPYVAATSADVTLTLAGQTLKVDLFAPQGAPPAPLIVGAHGLSGHKEELTGWGTHLATHGFAVAIPQFSGTDSAAAPGNADFEIALLDWMQAQGATTGNFFSGRADGARRAIFGHSMGGLVTHLAAAKSASIQVALALDGVDQNSMAAMAVPQMHAFPVELRASIQSVCNAAAPAEPAVIAAFPGPYLVLTVANTLHCDPQDPEMSSCELACAALPGPPWYASANHDAIKVFRRYATAAMRYFLLCDSEARSQLDGVAEQADVAAGLVTNVTAHNIGAPMGCGSADVDGGAVLVDAGSPIDAGDVEDAGSFMDAGLPPFDAGPPFDDAGFPWLDAGTDAGATMETDAGQVSISDGGVQLAPVGGCQCSASGDVGAVALLGLLLRRRRARSSYA
jgi:MYXO-CTERM domain-containing protein